MSSSGGRAWKALIDLIRLEKAHAVALFAPYDLTPQLAHALHVIPPDGMTMRALATELVCDASNATGIVDRLEQRGFLERIACDHDRRIKRVRLTEAGRRMRETLETLLLTPPPSIAALNAADQRMLCEIIEHALLIAETERAGTRESA
ncbi:MAG TPA: MarR family transcriptional regulator [Candidatus Limnocylindria bacterium]|jgi:DNA-binding MarR family transcriptional regulator|nr:MarR family transcriptional regulator [Candidatus Limnocylindria bacterium]